MTAEQADAVGSAGAASGAQDAPSTDLTPGKTLVLAAFAAFVWFCAAMFIRFAGPLGVFSGVHGIVTFALTIVATIPLNIRTRKIVRMPRSQMLTVVAITAATATLLDGVAMSQFPGLYGPDPAVLKAGAVWLLWAIGVALALALATSAGTERRP